MTRAKLVVLETDSYAGVPLLLDDIHYVTLLGCYDASEALRIE